MTDLSENIVTFRQAPDEFCAERRSAPWRRYRHALYGGFWLDQFRDDDGNSTLIMPDSMCSFGHGKREPWDRSKIIGLLGSGNVWVPEVVGRDCHDGQTSDEAYEAMAELPPEDYAQSWRQTFMEPLAISRANLVGWEACFFNEPDRAHKRGPKVQYDWEEFWRAMASCAEAEKGVPRLQKSHIENMRIWCRENWGRMPSTESARPHVVHFRMAYEVAQKNQ